MKTSEQIGTLAEALAKAQAQFPAITRNREVEVRSDKGNYKFEYATLDHVLELVRQPCAAQGIALVWGSEVREGKTFIAGRLIHASGQWIEAELEVPADQMVKNQILGSALTYRKRYIAEQLLGISASEDDDANVADGNGFHGKDRPPTAPKRAPKPPPAQAPTTAASLESAKALYEAARAVGIEKAPPLLAYCNRLASGTWEALADLPQDVMERATAALKRDAAGEPPAARLENPKASEALAEDVEGAVFSDETPDSEAQFAALPNPPKPVPPPDLMGKNWRGLTYAEWDNIKDNGKAVMGDITQKQLDALMKRIGTKPVGVALDAMAEMFPEAFKVFKPTAPWQCKGEWVKALLDKFEAKKPAEAVK